jgi:Skp family chaperone for outer membrane proteins
MAVAALGVSPDAMAQRNRGQATSAVVINYQRVAAESALGRDMQAKLTALRQQFAGEAQALVPEEQSLQEEGQRLAQASRNMTAQQIQNSSTLAPQFQQFQQRREQFEGRANQIRGDLECSNLIAMRDFQQQLEPVVRQVMQSRGAGLVIDASNVSIFAPEFDISSAVVQQLDQNPNTRTANVARHAVAECQQQPTATQ